MNFKKYFCERNGVIGSLELKNQTLPSKDDLRWEYGGKVQNIDIYPVKSFGGVSVNTSVKVTKYGLKFGDMQDRQFLIVDEKHNLVDASRLPKLVLIQPWLENGVLTLNADGMAELKLKLPTSSEGYENVTTQVWTLLIHKC